MKILILTFFIFGLLLTNIFAQKTEPTPTVEETKEAQELAAKFYNRFAKTQDITPLIKEFFVNGFIKNLRTKFFDSEETRKLKNAPSRDILQFYTSFTNYFFLYFSSYNHLGAQFGANVKVDVDGMINTELKRFLKFNPELQKYNNLNYSEIFSDETLVSLAKFRRDIGKLEKFNMALRKVELKFRQQAKLKNPQAKVAFTFEDFQVSVTDDGDEWTSYPKGTRIFKVTTNNFYSLLLQLVRKTGKLKIAIAFPELD